MPEHLQSMGGKRAREKVGEFADKGRKLWLDEAGKPKTGSTEWEVVKEQ